MYVRTTKECSRCGTRRPLTEFHRDRQRSDGFDPRCKNCRAILAKKNYSAKDPDVQREYARRYYQQNRDRIREQTKRRREANPEAKARRSEQARALRLKRYGLTPQRYDELLREQGGGCAVCGASDRKFHVDHCHATGIVRGILCHNCNVALGHLRDDPTLIRAVLAYLED